MKSIEVNTPHITGRQNKGDTADSEAHFNTSYPANHPPPKALNLKKCDTLKTLVLYPSFLQDSGSYCHFAFYQSVSIRVRILQAFFITDLPLPCFLFLLCSPNYLRGSFFSPSLNICNSNGRLMITNHLIRARHVASSAGCK